MMEEEEVWLQSLVKSRYIRGMGCNVWGKIM